MSAPVHELPRIAASLGDLEAMCGVSERTLRRWARKEGLPVCRVGGRVLVVVDDFLAWLRQHREASEDDVSAAIARATQHGSGA